VLVGHLLHLIEPLPLVVFRDLVLLEELLQTFVRVTAGIADDVAAFLGLLVDVTRQLFEALVGQRWNRNADHLAVIRRIQAEVGRADRFLDLLHGRGIERLRHDQRGLGHGQRRDLIDGHSRSVGVHVYAVEQAHGGAPGAHRCHLAPHAVDRAVHARLDFAKHAF